MAVLGLGTVQFGMAYGIANGDRIPAVVTVREILAEARAGAVEFVDTAARYGTSESVLGTCDPSGFKVVTKTPVFADESVKNAARTTEATFLRSLERLQIPKAYGLLIHQTDDLLSDKGPALYDRLCALKDQGRVEKIGVSVYDTEQIDAVMSRYKIELCQLQVNVFDQRFVRNGHIARLADKGVEVHVRSVFLQGLLLMARKDIPARFAPYLGTIDRWHAMVEEAAMSPVEAALGFVRDLDGVAIVLVGVTDCAQMRESIKAFASGLRFDASSIAIDEPALVDPRMWT